jgi:hypothetical protein
VNNIGKVTKLATYLDYLDTPDEELPGFWIDVQTGQALLTAPGPQAELPYLMGWDAFENHPELYDDVKPAPYLWTTGY